jgi:2-C-methyl-D-erythritol 4-phosphate cytidylyltransferase
VKEVGDDGLVARTLDRTALRAVQTPQVFRYDLLMRAHSEVTEDVTDDAAMLEKLGVPVKTYEGRRREHQGTRRRRLCGWRSAPGVGAWGSWDSDRESLSTRNS